MRSAATFGFHPVARRHLAACALFGLLLFLISGALYAQHRQREWVLRREQALHRLNVATELISREVHRVRADALYLANRSVLRRFVSGVDSQRTSLIEDFVLFVQQKELYDQLRLLDLDGHEVIRINYEDRTATSVDVKSLQDKSDRYYFQEATSLQDGEIFVSEFDLNVEHGRIEHPVKASNPIFDSRSGYLKIDRWLSRLKLFGRGIAALSWLNRLFRETRYCYGMMATS